MDEDNTACGSLSAAYRTGDSIQPEVITWCRTGRDHGVYACPIGRLAERLYMNAAGRTRRVRMQNSAIHPPYLRHAESCAVDMSASQPAPATATAQKEESYGDTQVI